MRLLIENGISDEYRVSPKENGEVTRDIPLENCALATGKRDVLLAMLDQQGPHFVFKNNKATIITLISQLDDARSSYENQEQTSIYETDIYNLLKTLDFFVHLENEAPNNSRKLILEHHEELSRIIHEALTYVEHDMNDMLDDFPVWVSERNLEIMKKVISSLINRYPEWKAELAQDKSILEVRDEIRTKFELVTEQLVNPHEEALVALWRTFRQDIEKLFNL